MGDARRGKGRGRWFLAALAILGAVSLMAADQAEAKRGFSFGSRGTRTYSTPAPTATTPKGAAPIQRSTTPQPANTARPQATPRPSLFGGGLAGGLMRGLLIGGLVGLLLGHGIGGFAGFLGLLLQGALLALVVMLVLRVLRGPQTAPAGGPANRVGGGALGGSPVGGSAGSGPSGGGIFGSGLAGRSAPGGNAGGLGSMGGMGAASAASNIRQGQRDQIGITAADLDSFETLLGEIETAFSREDQASLKRRTTPEVFSFFADELRANVEHGLRNDISDVKLLQGDLSEAWREGSLDYATVAMRYASRDRMVERASGRVVSGDGEQPGETTEVWTFVREAGGPWKLSAIQQG